MSDRTVCPSAMIYIMMQWHECRDYRLVDFNMSIMSSKIHTRHLLSPSIPKLKSMCYDLISQTLAPDNKTKWFHKSPEERRNSSPVMTAWFFSPEIQREDFCTASILSGHLFNLSPSFCKKQLLNNKPISMRSPQPLRLSVTQMRLLVFSLWVIAYVMGRMVNSCQFWQCVHPSMLEEERKRRRTVLWVMSNCFALSIILGVI